MAKKAARKKVGKRKIRSSSMTQLRSPARRKPKQATGRKFNPQGKGFDKREAVRGGDKVDEVGHFGSVQMKTGQVLKGKKHRSFSKAVAREKALGNKMVKRGSKLFVVPAKKATKKKK